MEDLDELYVLPCHPSCFSCDPLGICDYENPTVWAIIVASIHSFRNELPNIFHLPQLIENLSYSIHMNGHLDTHYLRTFLSQKYSNPNSAIPSSVLNSILDSALLLPSLFPTHTISYLNPLNPILRLSTLEIKSLLAHQILNTLTQPKGNNWGSTFSCWYSEPQPLETAVSGYLTSLFDYFTLSLDDTEKVTYQYYTSTSSGLQPDEELQTWMCSMTDEVLGHLSINPTSSKTVPFPHDTIPCTLIASNESPGFGTSCTQEELVTGACPPLMLFGALLVSPPIPSNAALLVYGNMPIFHWKGQGREAHSLETCTVGIHTFLFLDASELDTISPSSTLVDLRPQCILRDLLKVQTGFSALQTLDIKDIASPIWGAGAFGGDPIVKSLILAMAAAREDITVHLSVDENRSYGTGTRIESDEKPITVIRILQDLKEKCKDTNIGDLLYSLDSKYFHT